MLQCSVRCTVQRLRSAYLINRVLDDACIANASLGHVQELLLGNQHVELADGILRKLRSSGVVWRSQCLQRLQQRIV